MAMESSTAPEDTLRHLLSLLNIKSSHDAAATTTSSADVASAIKTLQSKLDGPSGVVHFLLPRLWMESSSTSNDDAVQGDDALAILSHLVESQPTDYMAITASAVRGYIQQNITSNSNVTITDALLLALAKLLIGPNSDNQVGIASDASASLLALCQWDGDPNNNYCNSIAKRVLSTINTLWYHLQQQSEEKQRESSTSQMRIASLMIDICLLGGEEMSIALSDEDGDSIMSKLLHIALDVPNNDPLLQVSALDQLERLTAHDNDKQVPKIRADFLLANDILRRGLLFLVGCPIGDLSNEFAGEWGEMDPINGGAALRLLTEICRVGVSSCASISEDTRNKFQLLLSSFQKALHNFHPQGELERLSYIYAVSSLVGSCAMVSSTASSAGGGGGAPDVVANTVLADKTLLHGWLSLHSRVSQPKLKSTVLCSLSQVMEPSIWRDENATAESIDNNATMSAARPSDSIVLQLYQKFSRANNERDSTELILASAKSPFLEERLGAYNILRALVMRGMCLRLLLLYNDGTGNGSGSTFLDWLLNQELESTSEGKKAKYQVVYSMLSSNSDIIGGLLPPRALRQLEEWKRTGPGWMTSVPWEMATE